MSFETLWMPMGLLSAAVLAWSIAPQPACQHDGRTSTTLGGDGLQRLRLQALSICS